MTMKFTFWLWSAFSISLLSCMEIKAQPPGLNIFSRGNCEKYFKSLLKHTKRHKITKRSSDLKPFDEYHIRDHINYIRVPTIFQTHFIKLDDMVTTDPNNHHNIFKTKPKIQTMVNSENILLHEYFKIDDENHEGEKTQALLTNYPSPPVVKNKSANDFVLEELLKNLQQTALAKDYLQPTHRAYEVPLNHFMYPPAIDESQIENCKLGNTELCCSFQNNVRIFRNLCEVILHNELSGEGWQVEHGGVCKNCNYACSKMFEPLCVSKNRLQYTVRNECLFNATICKHGEKDWKIVKKGICDENPEQQLKLVTDKYEAVPLDFRFTSSYKEQSNSFTLSPTTTKDNEQINSFKTTLNTVTPSSLLSTIGAPPRDRPWYAPGQTLSIGRGESIATTTKATNIFQTQSATTTTVAPSSLTKKLPKHMNITSVPNNTKNKTEKSNENILKRNLNVIMLDSRKLSNKDNVEQPPKHLNITIVPNHAQNKTEKSNANILTPSLNVTMLDSRKPSNKDDREVAKAEWKKENPSNKKIKSSNKTQQNKKISHISRKLSNEISTELENKTTTTETAPTEEKPILMYGTHGYSVMKA